MMASQPASGGKRPLPVSPAARAWTRFLRHQLAVGSAVLLVVFVLLAVFAPLIEVVLDIDPEEVDLFARLEGSSWAHPLGTDDLGRDHLARLLRGGQVSLAVGLTVALAAATLGTLIGLTAGFAGGRIDDLLMRFADGVISLPLLPLLIVLVAVDPAELGLPEAVTWDESFAVWRLVFIISLVGWPGTARLVRAATLSIRTREFVSAAKALGYGPIRIMLLHILPNAASPILVSATLAVGNVILFESVLSFLGLGIQPPVPSWGNMLTGAQELVWEAPMLAVWPGLLIFLVVIAFNLVGDGLQQALDPKSAVASAPAKN